MREKSGENADPQKFFPLGSKAKLGLLLFQTSAPCCEGRWDRDWGGSWQCALLSENNPEKRLRGRERAPCESVAAAGSKSPSEISAHEGKPVFWC